MTGIRLIAGLGNPGRQYRFTRHNAGALFLESLCDDHHGELKADSRFAGMIGSINIAGQDIRLLFPTTYMNHSGRSVVALAKYFKIAPEEILVAYDEIDLPLGTTRLKQGGGHGGHNGVRDIIQALGSREFIRLRIGVGHPGAAARVQDYVLSEPPKQEADTLQDEIDRGIGIVPLLVEGDLQRAMTTLHTRD